MQAFLQFINIIMLNKNYVKIHIFVLSFVEIFLAFLSAVQSRQAKHSEFCYA